MKFALRLFRPMPRPKTIVPNGTVMPEATSSSGSASFAFSLFRPHAKTVDMTEQKVLRPSPTMLAYMRGEPTCPSATNKTFGFSVFRRDVTPKPPLVAPKRPMPSFAFSLFGPPRAKNGGE